MKLDWPGVSQLKDFDNILILNKFFFFFFRAEVVVVKVNFFDSDCFCSSFDSSYCCKLGSPYYITVHFD